MHNTWRFGIDRVLAGVAMSDDAHAWIDSTLPLDDVSSNRVELAGQLAEFVDRLQRTVRRAHGARPLRDWLAALTDGITMLTRISDADAWQNSQMEREFGDVLADAGARSGTVLRLPDVKALLDRHLAGRPTRANFRTGTLTVCTMVPMRSVPHRVVCLVGLDDGDLSRGTACIDGDDVLARNPVTGERDSRSEDRQLLLDAVGAATEKLVITYTGANAHSGQPRPPAVPVAELLDALDATTPESVRKLIVVHHPLQPFDIRNVMPGELVPDVPFTFDSTVLRAAQASTRERSEQPKFISGPLPAQPHEDVALADLIGFFKDPVKGFFRALEYTLPWDVDGVSDEISVDIDALEQWAVGDRMLGDMLRGMTPDDARQAEWRRGTLPPGQLGWRKAGELREQSTLLAATALGYRKADVDGYDVDIDLGAGRRLTGTVSPVFGDQFGLGHLLQARRQAPAGVVDSVAGVVRSSSGPGLVGHLHRAGAARHARRANGASGSRSSRRWTYCATWWRSTTRAVASRCPCPSRRRTPGPVRGTRVATRSGRRPSSGSPVTIRRRTRNRPRYGPGDRTPG